MITTDNQLDLNEFRDGVGGEWPFLADPERAVRRISTSRSTPTRTIRWSRTRSCSSPGLRIFSIYNGYWYWGRPSLHELHLDLREVLKEIRPDFDLTPRACARRGSAASASSSWSSIEPAIRYTEGKTSASSAERGKRFPRPNTGKRVEILEPWA